MKLYKYIKLKEILADDKYYIDHNEGEIYSNKTRKKITRITYPPRSKIGIKVCCFCSEGKRYHYSVAGVIMADLGHITKSNCENVIVENISKNAENTRYDNLRIITQSELCKLEHITKAINIEHLKKYQFKPLLEAKKWLIKELKSIGKKPAEISEMTGYNIHTVKDYYYRKYRGKRKYKTRRKNV